MAVGVNRVELPKTRRVLSAASLQSDFRNRGSNQ